MKILESYKDWFKNEGDKEYDSYPWRTSEIDELENSGFFINDKNNVYSTYYYTPNIIKNIKEIKIKKMVEVITGTFNKGEISYGDHFYQVIIIFINKDTIVEDFDNNSFDKALKFAKKYIKKMDIQTKKYNL